jgi:hypothetical protein
VRELPGIVTSTAFWASIATMWAASGAWLTYVAAVVSSRQKAYQGVLNSIAGLEADPAWPSFAFAFR